MKKRLHKKDPDDTGNYVRDITEDQDTSEETGDTPVYCGSSYDDERKEEEIEKDNYLNNLKKRYEH